MSSNWLNSLLLRQGHLSTSQAIRALRIVASDLEGVRLLSQIDHAPLQVFDGLNHLSAKTNKDSPFPCSMALSRFSRRWVVERSFAWTTRFRRLTRDYERFPTTLAGLHLAAFAGLMLYQWVSFWSP